MPFYLVQSDITHMNVDVIVNAANTELQQGGGVCGAIFKGAGASLLQEACNKLSPIETGQAVITDGYNLKAKYIIHTAGPIYRGGLQNEHELLFNCYKNSLKLALRSNCKSIAFPLISSGIYGYPRDKAMTVAKSAIIQFLIENDSDLDVYMVMLEKETFSVSQSLLTNLTAYIDKHYTDVSSYQKITTLFQCDSYLSLEDSIASLKKPFSISLMNLIKEKEYNEIEVYKKANIDRKLFSKIKSDIEYQPRKRTILAFCIALELNLEESESLLETAGYTFSSSNKFDIILRYFILNKEYNLHVINESLFYYSQPLLGA